MRTSTGCFTEPFKKALSTDSTATSFASKIPTRTRPTGNGTIDLAQNMPTGRVPEWMQLIPYGGASADNDAFDLRVIGWHRAGMETPGTPSLYIPILLGQFTVTLSAAVGIAGCFLVATERFADTIINHATIANACEQMPGTVSAAAANFLTSTLITSPANDLVGMIEMRTKGSEIIEFTFDETTNTPAMNVLYRLG